MSQGKDYSRLSQIDYCIQNYYSKYLAASVNKTFREVNAKRNQEVARNINPYIAGLSPAPLQGVVALGQAHLAQRIANHEGKWSSKDYDTIALGIVGKWQRDKVMQRDFKVLLSELYNEVLRHNGGIDKDGKLAENTVAYFNLRLREAMVAQLARNNVPKSSAQYIASRSFNNSIISLLMPSRVTGGMEEEVNNKSEKMYNPSWAEKAAAWVGSEAIDWATLGGPAGVSSVGSLGKSVARTMATDYGIQKVASWVNGSGESAATLQEASQSLFHDPTASSKIIAGSKAYGRQGTELIARINDSLSKSHKIKVGRPSFGMEVKSQQVGLARQSAGSSRRMLRSLMDFFDKQAIRYDSTRLPPNWMAGKTAKQCRTFGSYFFGIAKQCSMERREGVKVNGRYMSLASISQRAYDYVHAAVLIDERTAAKKAEHARSSQSHSRKAVHRESLSSTPPAASYAMAQTQPGNGIQPIVNSQTQPTEGSYVRQEVNPLLSGWQKALDGFGFRDIGSLGQNLGYVFAMLPDMLIGMLTGKNPDMKMENNMLPLASIMLGMFTKNKMLKLMFMGMGGMSLLNNAGHAALAQRDRQADNRVRQYKIYQDEPLDPRIKNPVIKGKSMICEIDGQNLVIQINKDDALYCYEKGILPLNVLANSVLKAYDRERNNISMEYDRQQNMQEESRQSVQLK